MGQFESAAALYQEARPEYPDALYDALIDAAGLEAGDRLLEVGCATGKATLPLARRGFRITCVELGAALAAAARHNLAGFPAVDVAEGSFEAWEPPAGDPFDLVFAATGVALDRPGGALRAGVELSSSGWSPRVLVGDACLPGGRPSSPNSADLRGDRRGAARGRGAPAARGAARRSRGDRAERALRGRGRPPLDWELGYHVEAYIRLLDTFSGHIAMQRGNASGCTGRSDGDSRCDRADPAGTGARFCTSRVAAGGCPPDDGPAPGARDLRAR